MKGTARFSVVNVQAYRGPLVEDATPWIRPTPGSTHVSITVPATGSTLTWLPPSSTAAVCPIWNKRSIFATATP
jgi:hypothetical protein